MTKVCRAWAHKGAVRVETRPDEAWELPNPTPEGRTYDAARVLERVKEAGGEVDLSRWRRVER